MPRCGPCGRGFDGYVLCVHDVRTSSFTVELGPDNEGRLAIREVCPMGFANRLSNGVVDIANHRRLIAARKPIRQIPAPDEVSQRL